MKRAKILVVDDELNMRLVLKAMLKKEGYDVVTAADGREALEILQGDKIAVVATDLKMPRMDGMELLDRIMQDDPSLPVIILTAYGTVATAVDALKKGAFDYITKPFEQDELKTIILKAVKTRTISERDLSAANGDADPYRIVGASSQMAEIHEIIRKVSPTMATVLITGETGTGKELIARAIHRQSTRKDNPSSRSTARPSRRISSKANSSATRKGPSPAPSRRNRGDSSWRIRERSFWTRSARSRGRCRRSSSRRSRTRASSGSADSRPSRWTSALSRPRTGTSCRQSKRESSGRISSTASTSFPSTSRR